MYEPISIDRLNNYTEIVKELDYLLMQKENLKSKIGILKGVDYTKIKVTTGNGTKLSEQERYAAALQKINIEIDKYRAWLPNEHQIIKTQIARVKKWNYRKLLVLRYLEKRKWADITEEFFGFENDFEDEKNLKYKDKIMYWNRQALAELSKVSSKPYINIEKQLKIIKEEIEP